MPGLGTRDSRGERPYVINYVRGERVLSDSAVTLAGAKARIGARLAKRHNRGEKAQVYRGGKLVLETCPACAGLSVERLDNSPCDYCHGTGTI
jgi:hypothetical protein